jgi:conjugal transfer pilus assembly protein TraV
MSEGHSRHPAYLRGVLASFSLFALTGCGSLSGIGGTSSLSCPLPNGALCKPIAEVYKMPLATPGSQSTAMQTSTGTPQVIAGNEADARSTLSTPSTNNMPISVTRSDLPPAPGLVKYEPAAFATATRVAPSSGVPVRSDAKMLRVWIAPYEDDEGALRDHSYLYVMVDPGRWQVEYNQQRLMKQYAPIKAPKAMGAADPLMNAPNSARPASGGQGGPSAGTSQFPFLPGAQSPR